MNLWVLSAVIFVSSTTFILGLMALSNNPTRAANRFFAAVCGFSGLYIIVNFLSDNDQARSLLWSRTTFAVAVLMLAALLEFMTVFPKRVQDKNFQVGVAIMAAVAAYLSYLPNFITGTQLSPGHTDIVTGSLYPAYLVYVFVVIALVCWLATIGYRRSAHLDRERSRYIIVGLVLTTLVILTTNLILPLVTGNNKLSGIGPYAFLLFSSFSFYAIIRQQFLDIRLLAARSVTYLLATVTLGAAYVALAFSLSHLLLPDARTSMGQTILFAGLSLLIAFFFQPMREAFEHLTNHIFYRDRYDSREVLDGISRILVSELDIDRMLARTLDVLCRELHIEFGQLVIFNQDKVYRVGHFGPLPKKLLVAPELRRLGQGMVVADDLASGERRHLLDDHGLRVSLGLKTRGDFVGYLLLGDKLSGDNYTKGEIELLDIIGKELAVGIANAKAVAEIQAFNLTLQDRVNHATSRLRVANRHLKELDKTKDEFISMASHQLRTPLTTIKGYLSMMSEGDAGKLNAAQREFVNYAFDASERMVNLISDLLNVSRLEAGRFLIQTKPVDIVAMVGDEVRQLQQHADNKHIALIFEPPAEPLPPVELDDNKTRQVIMNFVDNAIYYTREGSVTVRLSRVGDRVRLEVVDTGIGVPEDAKKKLFSKFYRAENAQAIRPDGTGLGLYLARRVVADQNGTIIFKSTPGQGSTFGFELPIKSVNEKAGA